MFNKYLLVILFFIFSSFVSAVLQDGDSVCFPIANYYLDGHETPVDVDNILCESIFILGNYYYCNVPDDIIICEYGCEDGSCVDSDGDAISFVPECSSGYWDCEFQGLLKCINNSWSLYDICTEHCVEVSSSYAYCDVDPVFYYSSNSSSISTCYGLESGCDPLGVYGFSVFYPENPNFAIYQKLSFDNFESDSFGLQLDKNVIGVENQTGSWYMVIRYYNGTTLVNESLNYSALPDFWDQNAVDYEIITYANYSPVVLDGDLYVGVEFYATSFNEENANGLSVYYTNDNPFSSSAYYSYLNNEDLSILNPLSQDIRVFVNSVSSYSSLSNVSMYVSSYDYLNLSYGFGNWSSISVFVPDPLNYYLSNISTDGVRDVYWVGQSQTLNGDYYDFDLSVDGLLTIRSYARPVFSSFIVTYNYFDGSSLSYNLTLNITGDLSDVVQLKPFSTYYTFDDGEPKSFSGNYYFQYYNDIVFSVPDSNVTGVLTSSLPFSWREINGTGGYLNGSESFDYLIDYNCSISSEEVVYNISGDINLVLTCGGGKAYYKFTSYTGRYFYQTFYVNASNDYSYINDSFIVFVRGDFVGDYIDIIERGVDGLFEDGGWFSSGGVYIEAVSSNSSFLSYADSIGSSFPDESNFSSHIRVLIVLAIIVSIFVMVLTASFFIRNLVLGLHLSCIFSLIVSFFFVRINYINAGFPVFFSVLYLLFLVFSFRGGVS